MRSYGAVILRAPAPANGDLVASQAGLYVEGTVNHPRVMAKLKDSAGTVFTHKISNERALNLIRFRAYR